MKESKLEIGDMVEFDKFGYAIFEVHPTEDGSLLATCDELELSFKVNSEGGFYPDPLIDGDMYIIHI